MGWGLERIPRVPSSVVKGVLCSRYIVAMVHEAWNRASATDLPNLLSPPSNRCCSFRQLTSPEAKAVVNEY